MRESSVLSELRARIAEVEGSAARHAAIPFGVDALDRHLRGVALRAAPS